MPTKNSARTQLECHLRDTPPRGAPRFAPPNRYVDQGTEVDALERETIENLLKLGTERRLPPHVRHRGEA